MAAALSLGACTIVRVEGPARITKVFPGIIRIEPAAENATLAYRIRGLGIVPGSAGATLGYSEETVVAMSANDDCRIVLFDPEPGSVSELAALLTPIVTQGQVCEIGGQK